MQQQLSWLKKNHEQFVKELADLVKIPDVSTDGKHRKEIDKCAGLVCKQMKAAGLEKVELLTCGDSNPYAYGEWLHATGKPTVFLYSHYDVQPVHKADLDAKRWHSDPWVLTRRKGRLFGRGSADDKGAITAHLSAIGSFLKTTGELPVNVKVLVEGEEEVGSTNLMGFFKKYRKKIQSDVILVCDTENIDVGLPSITYSLRGIVTLDVQVESATKPNHSGMAGGALADAALALNVILSRLYWNTGDVPAPGFYDQVRPMTDAERTTFRSMPGDEAKWRHECGVLDGVHMALSTGNGPYEQTWRKPAATIIAQEASSIEQASNQVLPRARALVSIRLVPDMDPQKTFDVLQSYLTKDPPWGTKVTVKPHGSFVNWWMTDPKGPAFDAALKAMKDGFERDPIAIGCGGTIGFVGPLADLLGGAPALLVGIEDPSSNAHAPDESLHEGDWKKLMATLAHLFHNLGSMSGGVK